MLHLLLWYVCDEQTEDDLIIDSVSYSQEAMESQLKYEEATRERLTKLDGQLADVTFVVCSLRGNLLVGHTPQLSRAILGAVSSPLATKHCKRVWQLLAHAVFREWSTGESCVELP